MFLGTTGGNGIDGLKPETDCTEDVDIMSRQKSRQLKFRSIRLMTLSSKAVSPTTHDGPTELHELLNTARANTPYADLGLLERAYKFSVEAHHGQKRLSGLPFVTHSVEVARILSEMCMDSATIAAALLHDVAEDTDRTVADVELEFGSEIAMLVDGVTKISELRFQNRVEQQAENLRKMLIAMAQDVRVILIKLADRLHNMRTLSYLPESKIKRISRETLDIYAPLANRLGMARVKSELEDAAFRFLDPSEYYELARRVAAKRTWRDEEIAKIGTLIEQRLEAAGIPADVKGRPKHLYGVHRKIVEHGKEFDEIYDLLALRIITDSIAHCYGAVGIVHKMWRPMPGRFKDYIAVRKSNMYQSLHTTVMRDAGGPLEIQIRTEDMHRTAEVGIAAHWRYKEGRQDTQGSPDERLSWFRQMREWLQDPSEAQDFLDDLRTDLVANEVYVFTPKGDVKELPLGSTPLDFAYAIHTEVGNHCVGAKANNHIVPLRYNLRHGDVLEILTSKNQQPSLDWLDIVRSSRARTKIRRALRERETLAPVEEHVRPVRPKRPKKTAVKAPKVTDKLRAKRIRIEGETDIEVHFSKCCDPMPVEPVVGYVTRGRISVHRADCKNFEQICTDKARIVTADWSEVSQPSVTRAISVTAADRPNLLADLLRSFSGLILNIDDVRARRTKNENMAVCDFVIEVTDDHQLNKIVGAAKQVNGVIEVARRPVQADGRTHDVTAID